MALWNLNELYEGIDKKPLVIICVMLISQNAYWVIRNQNLQEAKDAERDRFEERQRVSIERTVEALRGTITLQDSLRAIRDREYQRTIEILTKK